MGSPRLRIAAAILGILVAAFIAGWATATPAAVDFEAVDTPSQRMDEWYLLKGLLPGEKNEGFVLFCGQETERAAAMLGLSDHVPTMLCMWHRESGYTVGRGDDGKSFGVTQTLTKNEKHWRRFWSSRGVELGTLHDPSTQMFFGVSEFYEKLQQAKGDEFDAVRRYNGSGWRAKRYAWRVFISRKNIYGYDLPTTPAAQKARKYKKLAE